MVNVQKSGQQFYVTSRKIKGISMDFFTFFVFPFTLQFKITFNCHHLKSKLARFGCHAKNSRIKVCGRQNHCPKSKNYQSGNTGTERLSLNGNRRVNRRVNKSGAFNYENISSESFLSSALDVSSESPTIENISNPENFYSC